MSTHTHTRSCTFTRSARRSSERSKRGAAPANGNGCIIIRQRIAITLDHRLLRTAAPAVDAFVLIFTLVFVKSLDGVLALRCRLCGFSTHVYALSIRFPRYCFDRTDRSSGWKVFFCLCMLGLCVQLCARVCAYVVFQSATAGLHLLCDPNAHAHTHTLTINHVEVFAPGEMHRNWMTHIDGPTHTQTENQFDIVIDWRDPPKRAPRLRYSENAATCGTRHAITDRNAQRSLICWLRVQESMNFNLRTASIQQRSPSVCRVIAARARTLNINHVHAFGGFDSMLGDTSEYANMCAEPKWVASLRNAPHSGDDSGARKKTLGQA